MKKVNLEWYVLRHDFNNDKIYNYNCLYGFYDVLKEAVKKKRVFDYISLKEFMKSDLMSYFWSRTEYEILVSGLFTRVDPEKIDVWRQIEMNFDRIVEYVNRVTGLNY